MYIITFFIILAVLVLIHEFGHFYAAKRAGVRVDEFGLGFPPRIWGFKKGETLYSINWIPFGGFVKIFGENYEESVDAAASGASVVDPRSFVAKPRWIQCVILAAGIAMNVLFAWVLFSVAYMSGMTSGVSEHDAKYIRDAHVIILDALPNSAAARGGLKEGDNVIAYRAGGATTSVESPATIQAITKQSGGKPITFEVDRLGARDFVTVTPDRTSDGGYAIGVSMDVVGKADLPFYLAFWEGAKLTGRLFVNIFTGIFGLIRDALLGQADVSQLSGPVGIARLVGDASKLGFAYLMSFTAFISLNLAALNLIPFPALDGGRIIFVIVEAVRRKPISPKIANAVNAVGFGLLIVFMLFITYKDIAKIVG
ncbi:MAG TPA: site-2 protease family protein [Candidatus Paceibacterota bacterium]|nr:site-2 protease family protein [Candidatus Paceibacterota bacterium]